MATEKNSSSSDELNPANDMAVNYIEDIDLSVIEEALDYGEEIVLPKASIVIVTYNTNENLLRQNLDSLKEQTGVGFEIIIIDNSDRGNVKHIVSKYNLKYLKLNRNHGLSLARNMGIKFSRGDIVIFLDDDAVPANNFVLAHIQAYGENDIFGLRGKSLPRTSNIYNYLESHYDLGDIIIPYFINLEGNSSFKRDILIKAGGFNPKLQKAGGFEGLELTYRIVSRWKDRSKLIYFPNAIIYHDFYDSFSKYKEKMKRHARYSDMLKRKFPDIFKFEGSYDIGIKKIEHKSLNFFTRAKLKLIQKIVSFIYRIRNQAKNPS